jgi:uncharacterized protein (TIGR02145 family)
MTGHCGCYPNSAYSAPSTWLSQQGLLYNWPAATGKQNTETNDQGQVAGAVPGANEVETVFESGDGLKDGKIQGICPNGWHLPSDREWNELEKEIYTNPELYSYYTDKTGWSTASWDSDWETGTGYRPLSATEAHGKAMKDICGLTSTNFDGRSKSLADGGFSVLPAGYVYSGSAYDFGKYAYLWSSSSLKSSGTGSSWHRYLTSGNASVSRGGSPNRGFMFSVRCKKD